VTASLPAEVQQTFHRFITTEYTTLDGVGQPITWPVTPYYEPGGSCIDVTTGIGYPKKANDARANPRVAVLFSDPTGSGIENGPAVLVQGSAEVDDRDLSANRARYEREALEKLPATKDQLPPAFVRGLFEWYFTRIYVHVRPERVYVWPRGDISAEPELLDARVEEVRSGHSEEPARPLPAAAGGDAAWDERIDELGARYGSAVLSFVAPDWCACAPSPLARRCSPGRPASPHTITRPTSPGSETSKCAAIWCATRPAGRWCRTSSSAGSSCRRRRCSRACGST
jgi:hypothetical protein